MKAVRNQHPAQAVPLPPGYAWRADCPEPASPPPTHLKIIFRKTLVFAMPKPDDWDVMDLATQMKSKRDYLCHRWGEQNFTFEEDKLPQRKFHGRIRVEQNNYYATFEDPTFETPNFDEQYRITTRLLEKNATIPDHLAFYDFKRALENAESATAVEIRPPEKTSNRNTSLTTLADTVLPANARQYTPVDQNQAVPAAMPVAPDRVFHSHDARIPNRRAGESSLPPPLEFPAQLHPVPPNVTRTQIATTDRWRVKASSHQFHSNDTLVENSQLPTSKKRPRTGSETITPASASASAPIPDNLDYLSERRAKKPRTGGDQAPAGQLHASSQRPAQDNLVGGPEPGVPRHSQNSFSTTPVQQPQRSHSNPNMLDLCVASTASGPAPHFYQPSPSLEPTALGSSLLYTEPMPSLVSPAEVYSPPSHQPTTVFGTNAQGVFLTYHQPMPVFATHPQGVFPTYPYDADTFGTNAQGAFPTHSQLTPVMVADARGFPPPCHQATPGSVATSQRSTPSSPKPSAPNTSIARHESMARGMSPPPANPDSPDVPNPTGQPGRRLCSQYGQGLIDSLHRNATVTKYRKANMVNLCQSLFWLSQSRHVIFDSMIEYVFALLRPTIGETREIKDKIDTGSVDPWSCFWAAYVQFCQQLVFKDPLLVAGLQDFRETRSPTSEAELVQAIHKIGGGQWVRAVEAAIQRVSAMPL